MHIVAMWKASSIAGAALIAAATMGCGSSDRTKKQLSELNTELTTLRADQDRLEERLEALELQSAALARRERSRAASRKAERPRLKVVRLAPDSAPVAESDEDPEQLNERTPAAAEPEPDSPRPVIRGTGDKVIKTGVEEGGETSRAGASDRYESASYPSTAVAGRIPKGD